MGNARYNGRIAGYDGKWELTQTIQIAKRIRNPLNAGVIDDEVIMYSCDTTHSYALNLTDKTTKQIEIVRSNDDSYVRSCFLLNEQEIVCGMGNIPHTGLTVKDAIRLYDRQWNLIRCISLPDHPNRDTYRNVDVFCGTDGTIVAAIVRQPNIYIINPTNGKIVNTITCKYDIALCGVLASGHMILHNVPTCRFLLIIDRKGVEIADITFPGKIHDITIDPLTEDIYVMYRDESYLNKVYAIDQLSSGLGETKTREILTFVPKPDKASLSRLLITSSGRLILCDGRDCFLYKKIFHLEYD